MNEKQSIAAKKAMVEWLSHPDELGKSPSKIEHAGEFDLYDMHYYIFKFKKGLFGDWLLGVCGGYEDESLDHCGHVFSDMKKYDERNAVRDAVEIVENIRAYWMNQAHMQKVQESFKENLKYISQTELDVDIIRSQFVKTENRLFLNVGEVDLPTGNIVVADPLAYLGTGRFSPVMNIAVLPGTYPVQVSIYRDDYVGIRMCTARLKVKDSDAVRYELAVPTEETASAKSADGVLSGFAVDAGMISFCDVQVEEEYRQFLSEFHSKNKDANHYDDYFAALFADSFNKLPAYQREGGDFIEWAVPKTGNRMVMVASGFGDGFYQCFFGYDDEDEICELTVPLINPNLFEE